MFAAISDVQLEKQEPDDVDSDLHDPLTEGGGRKSSLSNDRSRNASALSHFETNTPPPKIDKRLTQHHVSTVTENFIMIVCISCSNFSVPLRVQVD